MIEWVAIDAERDAANWFLVRNELKSLVMILMEQFNLTRDQAIEWLEHAKKVNDLREKLSQSPPTDETEEGP